MALPTKEAGVLELVAEEEKAQKRAAALAEVSGVTEAAPPAAAEEAVTATDVAVVEDTKAVALKTAATIGTVKPLDFLAEQGISDIKIDFTSFPIITLNNGQFSSAQFKNFGTEFEMIYMDKRDTFLLKGEDVNAPRDKKVEPELVYSDDGLHDNTDDHKPLADYIEEWKAKGWAWEKKEYTLVIGTMVGGVHDDEIVQLQVSPSSRGAFGGYLYTLGVKGLKAREVVTKVSMGAELGSGVKAYNPWVFKRAK
jgi:hypothetical protein